MQSTSYGQGLTGAAAVADFATVLIITLLFSTTHHSSARVWWGSARRRRIERQAGATAQIRIRASFARLLGFAALADRLGLELILGSLLAGATVAALAVDREHPLYVVKLGTVGYGFLVPIFFIVTGVNLNSPALVANHKSLALMPLLFAAMLVVKTASAAHYGLRYPRVRCRCRQRA